MNPKGILQQSRGLRRTNNPGSDASTRANPNGVASEVAKRGHNAVGVEWWVARFPKVARGLATLGWRTQSLWDCRRWYACPSRRLAAALTLIAASKLPCAPVRAADGPPPSRLDALVNLELSNEYLTPRGMIVHDKGLTFQPLVLGFANLYKGDGLINGVTFVPGVWSDFSTSPVSVHAPFGSEPKTTFVEIDPILGVSIDFAKNFTKVVFGSLPKEIGRAHV